jgi:hypothetical protein
MTGRRATRPIVTSTMSFPAETDTRAPSDEVTILTIGHLAPKQPVYQVIEQLIEEEYERCQHDDRHDDDDGICGYLSGCWPRYLPQFFAYVVKKPTNPASPILGCWHDEVLSSPVWEPAERVGSAMDWLREEAKQAHPGNAAPGGRHRPRRIHGAPRRDLSDDAGAKRDDQDDERELQ